MLFWTFYLFGSKLWRTGYMYVTSVTPFLSPLPFFSPSPSPDQNYDEQATCMSLAENAIVWWTRWHLIILRLQIIWPPSSTQTEWKKDGWRWLQSRRRPSSDGRRLSLICCWLVGQKCCFRFIRDGSPGRPPHSSGAVWESRWTSWAVRPNEPSGFRGRKDLLHRASALVTTCP